MKNVGIIALSILTLVNLGFTWINTYYYGSFKNSHSPGFQKTAPEEVQTTYIEESSTIDTVEKVIPSVVSIIATKELEIVRWSRSFFPGFYDDPVFRHFFGLPEGFTQPEQPKSEKQVMEIGGGSGFIFSEDGLIVTNKHVVADTEAQYTVVLHDGSELESEVLARDPLNDVAILQIKDREDKLPALEIGTSNELKVGQKLIAIGNALSEFQNTVTTGILSAKWRDIIASGGFGSRSNPIHNLLQTDAAINRGNSGWPLVNLKGQVIGINTAIAGWAEGIGFAIPMDDVVAFIENVEEHGEYIRPFLGIRYIMLDENIAKNAWLTIDEWAFIYSDIRSDESAIVPDSAADKAGLKIGDVITHVNDESVYEDRSLSQIILDYSVGDTITLTIVRDEMEQKLDLTLDTYPQE